MPGDPPTEEGGRTEDAGDAPTHEEPTRRRADQSTLGLAGSGAPRGSGQGELAALEVGDVLAGRFTVRRFIARGEGGAVYEASDALLRTRVALKVLGGHLVAEPAALERFRREVLLARRVSHPNVCRVYELYEATTARGVAIHFLTMELLEGESLGVRLVRDGPMTTDAALALVRQLCDGLAAAHAEGVVHGGLKSSNVLLLERGSVPGEQPPGSRVVITDFGIARAVHVAVEETPDSMTPEQGRGDEATAATDIYNLGAVLYEMVTGKRPFSAEMLLDGRLDAAAPGPGTRLAGLDRRWAAAIGRCLARQPGRRFQSARDVLSALDRPGRRPRVVITAAMGAALLFVVGAYALVRYRSSVHVAEPEKKAVLTVPRTKVAILGVRNELGSSSPVWLPTAVTELLAHEVAASESSLRVVGTDWVDLAHRSLGVSMGDDERTQQRLQALLDADVLVHGSISIDQVRASTVRLRLQALDAESRKELGSIEEDLGPSGARLVEVLPELGSRARNVLRASLSQEEEAALFASRAHNIDAVRSYAEGVMRWRRWDVEVARSYFEAAVAADSEFLQAQRSLAFTWGNIDRKKWREAWKMIRSRPSGLTARQAAVIDLRTDPDQAKRTALFEARPDNLEVGFDLAMRLPPRPGLQVFKRLRQLRAGQPLPLRFREAVAAKQSGETELASELLAQVAARATELGARWELGRVREIEGDILYGDPSRFEDALARYQEAERLYTEVGELPNLAELKGGEAFLLRDMRLKRETLQKLDEAAGLARRLGNRGEMARLMIQAAQSLTEFGEPDAARKKLQEARRELEALEEPLDGFSFMAYFTAVYVLAMAEANVEAAREALGRVRQNPFAQQRGWGESGEADLLKELDQREQARAAFAKAEALARPGESRAVLVGDACSLDCDGDQPAGGLACLAQRCRAEGPSFDGLQRAVCEFEEARCSFRARDLGRAERAARSAWAFFEHHDDYLRRVRSHAILLRVAAARGNSAWAVRMLRADRAEVEAKHHRRLAFEVALALGEAELDAGRREGRARLLKLEKDATSREFLRIARLAREALDRRPASSAEARH